MRSGGIESQPTRIRVIRKGLLPGQSPVAGPCGTGKMPCSLALVRSGYDSTVTADISQDWTARRNSPTLRQGNEEGAAAKAAVPFRNPRREILPRGRVAW